MVGVFNCMMMEGDVMQCDDDVVIVIGDVMQCDDDVVIVIGDVMRDAAVIFTIVFDSDVYFRAYRGVFRDGVLFGR